MFRPAASDARGVVSVHDAILALIPAILALAALVGAVLSWSWGTALAVGSVPASGTVGYALFYNPPTGVGEN
ncbi:hypothetical protein HZS55_05060 [Halosimplex rubrum]|uniref:Uncharacterized protein n=1 Tax=Halosimplex rubrum TaxID=869889 RepID=A0A7D5TKK7_9EURY|nr:hypothetical protein [Halosimplex rubrum]QLH76712.1 hypothetical protein HZS55_05060 [Halosimplex rubrum]